MPLVLVSGQHLQSPSEVWVTMVALCFTQGSGIAHRLRDLESALPLLRARLQP